MKKLVRRSLWCGLGIALIYCLALDLMPSSKKETRLTKLPLQGIGFTGQDLPLNAAEQNVFQRATVVKRIYQCGKNRFVLLAVDGAGDRHAIHDPLYCFAGAGWTVKNGSTTQLPGGQGRILQLTKDGQTAEAVYWITDGEHRMASASQAWWQSLKRRICLERNTHAFVLIVLQPVADGTINWKEVLSGFPELLSI